MVENREIEEYSKQQGSCHHSAIHGTKIWNDTEKLNPATSRVLVVTQILTYRKTQVKFGRKLNTLTEKMTEDVILGNSQKHLKLCQEADEQYFQNAEKLRLKYCKSQKHKKSDDVQHRRLHSHRNPTD